MSEEMIIEEEIPQVASPESINDLQPKMKLKGTVKRLELYGAFIDVGVGVDALIHISQLSQERVNRVNDVLNVGDEVEVWVSKVDPQSQQIMVTMVEPLAVDWNDLKKGQQYTGTVTRLENFGAFVNIGAEREGLVHISELSHDYVKHPSEALTVGEEVQVEVLGFSKRKRRIDLSVKSLLEKPESAQDVYSAPSYQSQGDDAADFEEEDEELPTAMEMALRKAMGDDAVDQMAEPERGRKRRRGGRKRRQRRENSRSQQEDLLSRTLQMQD